MSERVNSSDVAVEPTPKLASPPCLMHEVDSSYFGFWSCADVLVFLNKLLWRERRGSKAFADIGRAGDLHLADRILEVELSQGSLCVLLRQEVLARGELTYKSASRASETLDRPTLEQASTWARNHLQETIGEIDLALSRITDPKVREMLVSVTQLHRNQLGCLDALLTPPFGRMRRRHSRSACDRREA